MNGIRQVTRQLDILRTLAARRHGVMVRELANEFGVSKRTVQRDLGDLSEAGFALYSQRRDGQGVYWYLNQESSLPPVNFAPIELAALLFLENTIEAMGGVPLGPQLVDVLRRIKLSLPEATQAYLHKAAEIYAPMIRGQKPYTGSEQVIRDLNTALLEQRQCQVCYRAIGRDDDKTYAIWPLRLFYFQGGLYLIASLPGRDRMITQAVERIQSLVLTEEVFEISAKVRQSLQARYRDAFGIKHEEPMTVKVHFSVQETPFVKERVWHPSQRIEEQADGSVILVFRAGGSWEIKQWVLGFGAGAQVLEPESLRLDIKEELRAALNAY
jgi:predicted DNA-binding transcriptional regulator YafY